MRSFLSSLADLAILLMIFMGTWPILFNKPPVKPLVDGAQIEKIKNSIADYIRDINLDIQ